MSDLAVFRVDSSITIATGHVFRCLTIAKELRERGCDILFICRDLNGNIINKIKDEKFSVSILPEPSSVFVSNISDYSEWLQVSWEEDLMETVHILSKLKKKSINLIVDHYAIDYKWESEVKKLVNSVIIIDDLANRRHDCDMIIDQNLYPNHLNRYDNLTPKECLKFLGPEYAILRKEFFTATKRVRTNIQNIMIFFGGIDPDNITMKAIDAALEAQKILNFKFNIKVIGAKNSHQRDIEKLCLDNKFEYIPYANNMAQIMNWSDLAIGAGGTTSWERCALNLPAIVIAIADNQVNICEALGSRDIIKYLGKSKEISINDIKLAILDSCDNFNFRAMNVSSKFYKLIGIIL